MNKYIMDYSLTFQKRNPILFFILLTVSSITFISFKAYYFYVFLILLWLFLEYFYRLPRFKPADYLKKLDNRLGLFPDKTLINSNRILSPCYGTVKKIEVEGDFIRIISVLSVFDVHYQFSPIDGFIVEDKYIPGEFNIAYILKKSRYNERNHVIFKGKNDLKIEVIQIAGVLTRRIELLNKKKNYNQGEPYGLIHFGSRVDTIIPSKINGKPVSLLIKTGDKLYGPNTILCLI